MATAKDIAKAAQGAGLIPADPLESLINRADVKKKFTDMLGGRASSFLTSVISAYKASDNLKLCDPKTILGSAAIAASMNLPINSNLGFAHIVPYSGVAQFQMGWKGFVQLGIRSGQYKTMHTSEVYEDELESWNPLTAEFVTTEQSTWRQREAGQTDKIVGYVAFFRLTNGFEKYMYMDKEAVRRHGKRYSKAFESKGGQWVQNFNAMALKTVLKLLLSKYGILSIEMQRAIHLDQASTSEIDPDKQNAAYIDAIEGEAVSATPEAKDPPKTQAEPPKNGFKKGEDIPFGE